MNIRQHIKRCNHITPRTKLLVAVSGGADSVVMLDALYRIGIESVVAHCNFHLRGDESDNDAQFVANLAAKYNFEFCTTDFDTERVANERCVSIEMAARDLRYEWFEQMIDQYKCDYVAVAHNADDTVETFFLNLTRGTGIHGLRGMAEIRGRVLRPMLQISRADIIKYIDENQLEYRTDSTNEQNIYTRNKLRLDILPLLKEINPSFLATMQQNMLNLSAASNIVADYVAEKKEECVNVLNNCTTISISALLESQSASLLLFEWLSTYNFTPDISAQLFKTLSNDTISGKKFNSPTHYAITTRDAIEVYPNDYIKDSTTIYYINEGQTEITEPFKASINTANAKGLHIEKNSTIAYLDTDKIEYPIVLRRWQKGDSFIPFGMKGRKKLSDFFADKRLSIVEKSNVWVMTSNDNIIWVVGMRIDNRYAISPDTQLVTIVSLQI